MATDDSTPFNDEHPLYSRLKNYGLPDNDKKPSGYAGKKITRMMREMQFVFALTPEELQKAKIHWPWKRLMRHIAEHGFVEGELQPLLWDDYASECLTLYREKDKSFWAWKPHAKYRKLKKLGYHWTDIFEQWPCG
jgi:hypothetical protein